MSPGHGELSRCRSIPLTVLVRRFFEIVPGGDLEFLIVRYGEDAKEFESAVLRALRITSRWLGNASTQVNSISRPDVLQGQSPTVRRPYARLDNGQWMDHGSRRRPFAVDGTRREYGIHSAFVMGWEISTTVTRSTSSSVGGRPRGWWDYPWSPMEQLHGTGTAGS